MINISFLSIMCLVLMILCSKTVKAAEEQAAYGVARVEYEYADTAEPIERYETYRYPSVNQVYNLNTDDSRVYSSGGMCDFNLGAKVTLSDGTVSGDYDLMFFLSQIENVW